MISGRRAGLEDRSGRDGRSVPVDREAGRGQEVHIHGASSASRGGGGENAPAPRPRSGSRREKAGHLRAEWSLPGSLQSGLARDAPDGAGQGSSRVQHARALPVRQRVADRRLAGFQPSLRVSGRRREPVTAVPREPQDAERSVRGAADDRPRGRDALLRAADGPRSRHGGQRLQKESRTQDERQNASADLPEPEGFEPERSGERGEPENPSGSPSIRPPGPRIAVGFASGRGSSWPPRATKG